MLLAMNPRGFLGALRLQKNALNSVPSRMLSCSFPLREEKREWIFVTNFSAVYPYASHVVTRSHSLPRPDSVRPALQATKHISRGVMRRVDAHLTAEIDPDEKIGRLFSRRSPECVPAGSILMVESYLSANKTNTTNFSGVLIAVRRAGIATTFVLRAIAHKLGVEARFHAYSPMIKEITVIQRAEARKGERGLLRTRRSKLYYLRRRDDRRVNSVANVVKQYRASQMQQTTKPSPKPSKKK